ncbi:MAG: hypothetical protein WCE21_03270 [Candidatus Babeliales bacterium]
MKKLMILLILATSASVHLRGMESEISVDCGIFQTNMQRLCAKRQDKAHYLNGFWLIAHVDPSARQAYFGIGRAEMQDSITEVLAYVVDSGLPKRDDVMQYKQQVHDKFFSTKQNSVEGMFYNYIGLECERVGIQLEEKKEQKEPLPSRKNNGKKNSTVWSWSNPWVRYGTYASLAAIGCWGAYKLYQARPNLFVMPHMSVPKKVSLNNLD